MACGDNAGIVSCQSSGISRSCIQAVSSVTAYPSYGIRYGIGTITAVFTVTAYAAGSGYIAGSGFRVNACKRITKSARIVTY